MMGVYSHMERMLLVIAVSHYEFISTTANEISLSANIGLLQYADKKAVRIAGKTNDALVCMHREFDWKNERTQLAASHWFNTHQAKYEL
jgi:hypothetical protein